MNVRKTRISGSEFKYVEKYKWDRTGEIFFKGQVRNKQKHICNVHGQTAKECALKLDKKLIELGLEPINILKRV